MKYTKYFPLFAFVLQMNNATTNNFDAYVEEISQFQTSQTRYAENLLDIVCRFNEDPVRNEIQQNAIFILDGLSEVKDNLILAQMQNIITSPETDLLRRINSILGMIDVLEVIKTLPNEDPARIERMRRMRYNMGQDAQHMFDHIDSHNTDEFGNANINIMNTLVRPAFSAYSAPQYIEQSIQIHEIIRSLDNLYSLLGL